MLKSIHLYWCGLSLPSSHALRFDQGAFKLASFFDCPVPSLDPVFCNNLSFHFIILRYSFGDPRWGNSYSQVVQNKEEWSRLIGYGSGLLTSTKKRLSTSSIFYSRILLPHKYRAIPTAPMRLNHRLSTDATLKTTWRGGHPLEAA